MNLWIHDTTDMAKVTLVLDHETSFATTGVMVKFSWNRNSVVDTNTLIIAHGTDDGRFDWNNKTIGIKELANELLHPGYNETVYLLSCHPKTKNFKVYNFYGLKIINLLAGEKRVLTCTNFMSKLGLRMEIHALKN